MEREIHIDRQTRQIARKIETDRNRVRETDPEGNRDREIQTETEGYFSLRFEISQHFNY